MHIVALAHTHDSRNHIVDALRHRAEVSFAGTAAEAVLLVVRTRPTAVLVELTDAADTPGGASAIERLRAECPSTPIVAYCWVAAGIARQILRAVRAGVSALALRGHDDIGRMMDAVLEDAVVDLIAEETVQHLGGDIPGYARPIVEYCVRHARDELTVVDLATGLGLPRRTLDHRLRRAALPAPGALISWGRLFVAAKLMETSERSVDDVALSLGFASGSALRGMLKRYTGLTPGEVRARGGLQCVVDALGRTLPDRDTDAPVCADVADPTDVAHAAQIAHVGDAAYDDAPPLGV